MKEFQYTVKDACGIHARPAGLLVKVVKGFSSTATLEKNGKTCDLRKLMALMGMGVKQGETVTVKDACGIHARPAGLLVKVVKGFSSTATLEKNGKTCDLRKLMALMGMGVKQGDTVTIKVEGDDEAACAEAIQKFLSENV